MHGADWLPTLVEGVAEQRRVAGVLPVGRGCDLERWDFLDFMGFRRGASPPTPGDVASGFLKVPRSLLMA